MRRALAVALAIATLTAGCLRWIQQDEDVNELLVRTPTGTAPRVWLEAPPVTGTLPPMGAARTGDHFHLAVPAYAVARPGGSLGTATSNGSVVILGGMGWAMHDLLTGEQLYKNRIDNNPYRRVAAAENPDGRGVFIGSFGQKYAISLTQREAIGGATVYDGAVRDIAAALDGPAFLLNLVHRLMMVSRAPGSLTTTMATLDDIDGVPYDSAYALSANGPLLAIDAKGDVWSFPQFRLGGHTKSGVQIGLPTQQLRCGGGVCAATSPDHDAVTFFAIGPDGRPTGAITQVYVPNVRGLALVEREDHSVWFMASEEIFVGFMVDQGAEILESVGFQIPDDCETAEDVAAWLDENPLLIQVLLACGDAGAFATEPFDPERTFRMRASIF